MEILFAAVFLVATWHGFKHGTPRAFRAVSARRRTSVSSWQQSHPTAPKSARWAAGAARGVTALRWGPGHFRREFAIAFREAWDDGKQKYRLVPPPAADPDAGRVKDVDLARGMAVWDDEGRELAAGRGTVPLPDGHPARADMPSNVTPIRRTQPTPNTRSAPMPVATVTGGEVTSPETLKAELDTIVAESAAELEDAAGDAQRAREDMARIEVLVGSLTNLRLTSQDVALVQALLEPAQQREAAATARAAAAEHRLSAAQAALAMAARHVELQDQGAAGDFYRAG